MKKTGLFLLLSLFAFQMIGIHGFFLYKIAHARAAFLKEEAHHPLVTFGIPREEMKEKVARVGRKEIVVEGKMYDVVEEKERDGIVFFTAYQDDKEKKTIDSFSAAMDEGQPGKTNTGKIAAKVLSQLFEEFRSDDVLPFPDFVQLAYSRPAYSPLLLSLKVTAPPPELV